MGKLANEITLELNITHELINTYRVGTIGFTQQNQEPLTGADIQLLISQPTIIQYKAAKSGIDGVRARFRINNNQWKNQHQTLDSIDRSGIVDAYYAFPLIISDSFLATNFGRLTSYTCMVPARLLTGSLNWVNQAHSVVINNRCIFSVSSSESHEGRGFPATNFWGIFERRFELIEIEIEGFIKKTTEALNATVQEDGIVGNSEHTMILMGTDRKKSRFGFVQLPILIEGLREQNDEKVKFH